MSRPVRGGLFAGAYADAVGGAVAFLEGRDASPLGNDRARHEHGVGVLQFERAAALRDKLAALQWLTDHLTRLHEAARQSFVYAVPSADGPDLWYAIHGGRVRAGLPAPHNDETRRRVGEIMEAIYPKKASDADPLRGRDRQRITGVVVVSPAHCRTAAANDASGSADACA